jgi:hypothetical protein
MYPVLLRLSVQPTISKIQAVWSQISKYLAGDFSDNLVYADGLIYTSEMEALKDIEGKGLRDRFFFNGATITPTAPIWPTLALIFIGPKLQIVISPIPGCFVLAPITYKLYAPFF